MSKSASVEHDEQIALLKKDVADLSCALEKLKVEMQELGRQRELDLEAVEVEEAGLEWLGAAAFVGRYRCLAPVNARRVLQWFVLHGGGSDQELSAPTAGSSRVAEARSSAARPQLLPGTPPARCAPRFAPCYQSPSLPA